MLLTKIEELSRLREAAKALAAREVEIRQALMLEEARRTIAHEEPEDLIVEFAVPQVESFVKVVVAEEIEPKSIKKPSARFLRNLEKEVIGLSLFSEFLGMPFGSTYLEVQKSLDLTKIYVKRDIDCWYYVEGSELKDREEQILYLEQPGKLAVYLPPTLLTERKGLVDSGCKDFQTAFFMLFDLHQGIFAERLEVNEENTDMIQELLKESPYILTCEGEWKPLQEYEIKVNESFAIVSGKNLFLVKPRDNSERRRILKDVFLNMPAGVESLSNKYEHLSY